jgi:prepilin-type N-terminal cleavage/methylation domain-containing protein
MKRALTEGFTLVELLIVIALIAILSVAVLATINPIEQTNKARDARVQNDAAEVMNAYERYYASLNRYPWMEFGGAGAPLETAFQVLRSDTYGFGICSGAANQAGLLAALHTATAVKCDPSDLYPNFLVSTSELKSSFVGKDSFQPLITAPLANAAQAMWTVKAGNANSIYVCYVPKANANRVDTAKLRCIDQLTGIITKVGGACTTTVADWAAPVLTGTSAMFKCVPE